MPNVITDITIPCQHIHWDFFPQLFQENTSILVVPRSCLPFGFPSTGHEQPAHTGQGGDLDSRSEIWERRRVYFHVGVWLGSSGHLPSPSAQCSTLECPRCPLSSSMRKMLDSASLNLHGPLTCHTSHWFAKITWRKHHWRLPGNTSRDQQNPNLRTSITPA